MDASFCLMSMFSPVFGLEREQDFCCLFCELEVLLPKLDLLCL